MNGLEMLVSGTPMEKRMFQYYCEPDHNLIKQNTLDNVAESQQYNRQMQINMKLISNLRPGSVGVLRHDAYAFDVRDSPIMNKDLIASQIKASERLEQVSHMQERFDFSGHDGNPHVNYDVKRWKGKPNPLGESHRMVLPGFDEDDNMQFPVVKSYDPCTLVGARNLMRELDKPLGLKTLEDFD